MKGGWMLVAGLVMIGACSGDGDEPDPSGQVEAARTGPARPPEAGLAEGMYVLAGINGAQLPGVVQQNGECRVEVVDGSLRLEAGRFAFQNRAREVCNTGTQPEPVMHAAGGTYTIDGNNIVLTTDVGDAFAAARGAVESTTITLREISTDAGTESVAWQLRRDDSQLVPPQGTRDGSNEDAADMSTTPGATRSGGG